MLPVLPLLVVRTTSRSFGCRTTEKRVETARLGNTVAMTHYRRVVNTRGHQERNGHDPQDKAHLTLPLWRDSRPATVPRAFKLIRCFHRKCFGCCPLSTGLKQGVEKSRQIEQRPAWAGSCWKRTCRGSAAMSARCLLPTSQQSLICKAKPFSSGGLPLHPIDPLLLSQHCLGSIQEARNPPVDLC